MLIFNCDIVGVVDRDHGDG